MAKRSSIETNNRRKQLIERLSSKRNALKEVIYNRETSFEDRFEAQAALNELPRNSSPVRYRLRCKLTGRSRGNYRKFELSRIALRQLVSWGMIPGCTKSSW